MDKSVSTKEEHVDEVAALRNRIAQLEALLEIQRKEIKLLHSRNESMFPKVDPSRNGDDEFLSIDYLYRAVFESTGTAMLIVDEHLVIQHVNSELEIISGYSRDEVEGRNLSDFIPSDNFKRMMEHHKMRKIDPTLPPRSYEFAFIDRNGCERCAYVTVAHIPEAKISIASFIDITEKKKMEEALRASEDRYRTFIDSASDMIFLKDDQYRYLIVNKILSDFFGKEEDEIIGRTDFELMPEDAARQCNQSDDKSLEERSVVVSEEHVGERIFETLKFPVQLNPGTTGVGAFIRDITDKKRIQDALQESEEKYRLLIDNVGQAIFVARDGVLKFANPRMIEVSGYAEEDITSRPFSEFVHPDDRKLVMEYHVKRTRGEELPSVYTFRVIDKTGTVRWMEINTVVITWEGRPAILCFGTDVTARRKAEEALRLSEQKHRTLVETMNEGFGSADENYQFNYVNQKFADMLGYTKSEMVGHSIKEFIPADYRDVISDQMARRKKGESERYEMAWVSKGGRRVTTLVSPMGIFDADGCLNGSFSTITDITEIKRIDADLRESEERFRLLADYAPIGISLMKPNGTFEYFNPSFITIFGYESGDLPDKQTWFEKAYPEPAYRQKALDAWDDDYVKRNERGALRNRTFKVCCKNGIEQHIHFRGCILENGKYLLTYEDVTELVRAEEALRESEKKYREFVEFLPQSVFEFNIEKIFTFTNRHALETFGYSESDFMQGVSVLDLIAPHDRWRAAGNIEMIMRGDKRGATEYTALRKDGNSFPVVVYSTPILIDGKPQGLRGIIVDITESKQAENALRESEARFRTLIESAQDFIFIKDRMLQYVLVNPAMARLFNMAVSDITGKTDSILFGDEEKLHIRNVDLRVLNGEIVEQENTLLIRDEPKTFHVIKTPMYNDKRHIIGICGIARDVTDFRKMEDQLRDAQKMEAIGTLAGGIAHDFNNLLMAIQGYTALLLLDLDADHPHYEKLKKIETNVDSGADLTRQLLGFAQSGRYEVKPLDINETVGKAVTIFSRTRKEILINRDYQDSIWIVDGDSGQIEQVLLNLFINAWQAMPKGGEIRVETKNVTLHQDDVAWYGVAPGRYVKISVRDTGVGMDEKTQQRIFEPFFTTKEMKRGAGLGLAVVYGIVKGHGGLITVESEHNQGTTFHIYLPASVKKIVSQHVQETLDFHGRKTVLLVDDEEVIVDVTSEIIAALGYDVLVARSGEEAVEMFKKECKFIDLVILDMIMPGMGGGETFDVLRGIDPGIKVILSSGYSIDGSAREIMERGCNAFLQKPYQIDNLRQKIKEVLN